MKHTILACALVLGACNVLAGSDMPNLESADEIKAAVITLDPVAPGGSPDDTGFRGLGQPGSDRYLFAEWVRRNALTDAAMRMNIDYKPAPVPASVAEAIEQQRAYEAKLGGIDIQRSQIMAAARWTKPVK